MQKKYYLGLDIGTDSVGYAAVDTEYNLLKFRGEPAWGTHLFDAANLKAERRGFRTARRRLDRRQQRVDLINHLFAVEVCKLDPRFFVRRSESALFPDDKPEKNSIFNDKHYTDKDYHAQYPTIHHLICELMANREPHDVRLVYLACAWLVAHRGHFLSEIDKNNLQSISSFEKLYTKLAAYLRQEYGSLPWGEVDVEAFGNSLKLKTGIKNKSKQLASVCFEKGKVPKYNAESGIPFDCDRFIKLLCGGHCKLTELFPGNVFENDADLSLELPDEELEKILASIDEYAGLVVIMKEIYDWALLSDMLDYDAKPGEARTISGAKVKQYEQHKADLAELKRLVRKYRPGEYNSFFRGDAKDYYTAYSYHGDIKDIKQKAKKADFYAAVKKLFKDVKADAQDEAIIQDIYARIDINAYMPKQRDGDNRVIPRQLYEYELDLILANAETYLPFLLEKDGDGLTVSDKIKSVFSFRVPYFVGPLHKEQSDKKPKNAWIERRADGKIKPWNFEKLVDLDKSEDAFISRLVGKCTYLPEEDVLPFDSLLYREFTLLNEINNLKSNGIPISVEAKQAVFALFEEHRKVSVRMIQDRLVENGYMTKNDTLSGIDISIKSSLCSYVDFKQFLNDGTLTPDDVEKIIARSVYCEQKSRLRTWLDKEYPGLTEKDKKSICSFKYKDFGRLSRRLLTEIRAMVNNEEMSIIEAMRKTNLNFMELMSNRYGFLKQIEAIRSEYFNPNSNTDGLLDMMYISNAVRRPIYRALEIVDDVIKAFGKPEKIFIEMARGASPDQKKGLRVPSRKQQLLDLYKKMKDGEFAQRVQECEQQLEQMGDDADNRLRSDKLYLYYIQLGRCMYTDKPISLSDLAEKDNSLYNIDHIVPQSLVKDDSILDNLVLVDSKANSTKGDRIVPAEYRSKMQGFWKKLLKCGLITQEKYDRLTRTKEYSLDEKIGFINRQLTETTQSTKAVAILLQRKLGDTEIVYVKSHLAADLRRFLKCPKSRTYNDLHHAKDAYLNIVAGNVYHSKFIIDRAKNEWASVKPDEVYTHELVVRGVTVWHGKEDIKKVVGILGKNNAHLTRYSFCRHGGYFDQMPLKAAEGLVPRKKELPAQKYGGYNKPTVTFFLVTGYRTGKKSDVMVMPVELLHASKVLESEAAASEYAITRIGAIIGKTVDDVWFPMGLKPVKVNSVLSLDGFRVYITGTGSGGQKLMLSTIMAFAADSKTELYVKRLEKLVEKADANPGFIYRAEYDNVTAQENIALYSLYLDKFDRSVYCKRPNNILPILKDGKEKFEKLGVIEQARVLLNIQAVFGHKAGGTDFTAIGGSGQSGVCGISTNISNWKKKNSDTDSDKKTKYSDVHFIYSSASGLWETHSANLLELK